MDKHELDEGKERVRKHLIEPLELLQLRRPRKVTQAAQSEMIDQIVNLLAWLPEGDLVALREQILMLAGGPLKNEWPSGATVLNLSRQFGEPPASDSEMVVSFMRSNAGTQAARGGYWVELYLRLKDGKPPRGKYDYDRLRESASDNRRRRQRLNDNPGSVGTSDERWLHWYQRVADRARALLSDEGKRAIQ